jgi:2-succinyl-5-enolpyruvyl-6-hydroxy-3-cyclohexene-1-carboxylate synthase
MYTDNLNQQILIALLKEHGIKKIVASPGGTNPALVISMQSDSFFEMYSCVDERSAAYMACGLAEEANEPVMICCTGATASRNYMSALTEAFYRKLPILVLTCSKPNFNLGHLYPQVTNRNVYPADILTEGVHLQVIKDDNDKWDCEFKVNKAILALTHHGGGPSHINIECITQDCTTPTLPLVHPVFRINYSGDFPKIAEGRIGIFIGSHKKMNVTLQGAIEHFCEQYNGVVLCDHTSGYHGKYSVKYSLIGTQIHKSYKESDFDLIIHLGEMSGDYLTFEKIYANSVWRVSEDGEIRIRFRKLDYVFEMHEIDFFNHYITAKDINNVSCYNRISNVYKDLYSRIPELPLSHIYIAHFLAPKMPKKCTIHFAILNSLRSWNFFDLDSTINCNCNVGGFGIDGCTSSLIGASLVHPEKLYFLFTGDLAFFYDLNALGNRHIRNNVRIMLVNDGKGAEFMHFMSPKYAVDKSLFMSAGGHFANQSKELVKHYAQDLGFEYMQATNKDEFLQSYKKFIDPAISSKPILFEIIISTEGQSQAWEKLCNLAELSKIEEAEVNVKKGIKSFINVFKK